MSDDYLVRHCAPTLAGIKTASLFTCPCPDRDAMLEAIRRLNERLRNKGLRVLPLRFSQRKALIYLYRPGRLMGDLSQQLASELLRSRGYDTASCEKCLSQLARRLRWQEEFPHEIGLFLGYPPEDVLGFIQNNACGCKCVGCWKVYGDEEAAKKRFAQYQKCSRLYREQWEKGKNIERLTVSG